MREWMIAADIATEEELKELESQIKKQVREGKNAAWNAFLNPQKQERDEVITLMEALSKVSSNTNAIQELTATLKAEKEPIRKDILATARKALRYVIQENSQKKQALETWKKNYFEKIQPKYSAHLYSENAENAKTVKEVLPTYDENSEEVDGRIILRDNFDYILKHRAETVKFVEDSGTNAEEKQGVEGL